MSRQIIFFANEVDLQIILMRILCKSTTVIFNYDDNANIYAIKKEDIEHTNFICDKYWLYNYEIPCDKILYSENDVSISCSNMKELPVIELSSTSEYDVPKCRLYCPEGDFASSPIYYKWYKKCSNIIKNGAVEFIPGSKRIYIMPNIWKCAKEHITEKFCLSSENIDYTVYYNTIDSLEHSLCLKLPNKCINNCKGCIKDSSIPTDKTSVDIYLQKCRLAFNKINIDQFDFLVVGANYEPLSIPCWALLNYIKNNSKVKIVFITNGINVEMWTNRMIDDSIDYLYLFIPGKNSEEYLIKTDSSYGLSSFGMVNKFLKILKKCDCSVNICWNKSRNDVMKQIISVLY